MAHCIAHFGTLGAQKGHGFKPNDVHVKLLLTITNELDLEDANDLPISFQS